MTKPFTTYDHNLARQKFCEGYDVYIVHPDPRDDVRVMHAHSFEEEEGHLFEIKSIPLKPLTLTGSEVSLLKRLIRSQQNYFECGLDSFDVYSSECLDFMLKTNQLREKLEANL